MGGQRFAILRRELARTGIQNFEATIIDLIPVDHADIFGTGPKIDTRLFDPLNQSCRSGYCAFVGQLLSTRHPHRVLLSLCRQAASRIPDWLKARPAPMEIYLGSDRIVQKRLVDLSGWNNRLCRLF